MLSEVCRYLNNWFDSERLYGEFTISGGILTGMSEKLQTGQHFRIIESVFNDGVHEYQTVIPSNVTPSLKDETFDGSVWLLKIPPEVIEISEEIDDWQEKYLGADSAALSPFTSESFGGYSYTKGATADGKSAGGDWTQVSGFTSRLDGWRKPRCRY